MVRRGTKNGTTQWAPLTTDMASVPFCLTTIFKPFKTVFSSGPIERVDRGFNFKGKLYNLNNTRFGNNTHLAFQATKLVLESKIVWLLNVIRIMAGKWNLNWEQFSTVNIIRNVSVLFLKVLLNRRNCYKILPSSQIF